MFLINKTAEWPKEHIGDCPFAQLEWFCQCGLTHPLSIAAMAGMAYLARGTLSLPGLRTETLQTDHTPTLTPALEDAPLARRGILSQKGTRKKLES